LRKERERGRRGSSEGKIKGSTSLKGCVLWQEGGGVLESRRLKNQDCAAARKKVEGGRRGYALLRKAKEESEHHAEQFLGFAWVRSTSEGN